MLRAGPFRKAPASLYADGDRPQGPHRRAQTRGASREISRRGEGGFADGAPSREVRNPSRVPRFSRRGEGGFADGAPSREVRNPSRVPRLSRSDEVGARTFGLLVQVLA